MFVVIQRWTFVIEIYSDYVIIFVIESMCVILALAYIQLLHI